MTRRFEVGPALAAVGAVLLLVSLFLDWYGPVTAWQAFELTDVVLAALAVGVLATAAALLVPAVVGPERRWLPWLVGAAFVLIVAQILSTPPAVGGEDPTEGAWIALGATLAMAIGTVLSYGRVSLAIAVEERQRVAAVDHRPPPTETGAEPVVRHTEE